jgi:hypothetical protein
MSKTTEEQRKNPSSAACEGKFVSLTGNKLVMTSNDGKQSTLSLAKDAKLTCDGTSCRAQDLKAGGKIRVTTKKDDKTIATGIESLKKNAKFAQCH